MTLTARLLTLLAVISLFGACAQIPQLKADAASSRERERVDSSAPTSTATPLQPSPNRLVGRVLAVDLPRGFAFINLTTEPPPAALVEGAELIARTLDLRETARLRASRYARGRTLGTTIISGQPSPGDEVVFHAP